MINGWSEVAFNQAQDSANQIHGDQVARRYGFRGGLVPGVTISAYLTHPAVEAWGKAFLDRGHAHVRVGKPLYDEEPFTVRILEQSETTYSAEITQPDGTVSATAEASLPELAPIAPERRGDRMVEEGFVPPEASMKVFETLQQTGCRAFRYRWGGRHNMQTYVRDAAAMPHLLSAEGDGYANMAYLLGCSNWILASNAHMNPWVHLETRSQNYRAVPPDTSIVVEMAITDFYEKKGHEFVDADVNLFDEADDACLTAINLRAIYKLRGT